jgi:hypothetical protein
MAHETRTDFSMLLGSLFLFIVGPGTWNRFHRPGTGNSTAFQPVFMDGTPMLRRATCE